MVTRSHNPLNDLTHTRFENSTYSATEAAMAAAPLHRCTARCAVCRKQRMAAEVLGGSG